MNYVQNSHLNDGTGFLSLPAEIRNRIYYLSLVRGIFCIYNFRGRPWSTMFGIYEPAEIPLGLLQANRQILIEAAPVLYGANKFIFPDVNLCWSDLERWLEQIGTRNLRAIRELGIFPPNPDGLEIRHHKTMVMCGELLGTAIDLRELVERRKFMINKANGTKILCLSIVWKNKE